ncbi:hypothetical protein GLOTRDRAFT_71665 [Gloeophyllum trabeum ATCC 11539]|uniref:Zn(2)-C6 fungal-type domain-containing protein n=1 Tax=Gloeophyllum trabeum (strain ATCC 11539 / FP-39264 / Madison 617) TaxID=670483 RepID=S7RWQ2_GLOTA|nr:uncharacterized protein GLOTRDRAFT_71665 [Gloeophyllum trabeum ATCC 11539]EPQ57784.1 hypothetical protein GLOTRDRAFT_71665 [Gloeophyllum trabeum ATCC 11539]
MFPPNGNANGKRPPSLSVGEGSSIRKKARKEEEADSPSPAAEKEEPKPKTTRGSRACTVCRRLKMKCVGAEHGPPCKRCQNGNHECIFEESNRGKRSAKKHELLTRSLRKMERTLDTVLRAVGNPNLAASIISRSPSPSGQTTHTFLDSEPPTPQDAAGPSGHRSASHLPQPPSPQLHSLPDNSLNPLGLLAEASLANRKAQAASKPNGASQAQHPDGDAPRKVGVASEAYFKPGPMTILPLRRLFIERQVQPEMLSFVNTEEVVALFKIYFTHMNMHCNLLDPEFHTPSLVCSRSPFLLTTICAVASKFYEARPELHSRLTDLARKLAFNVPAMGYKSVEIVQAYLLLVLWGCGPVERFEQDKTWFLMGMAIRMATDLNLHRKQPNVSHETAEGKARDREVHNRERTWLLCFCLDRSLSAQMGKPHSIKEDFIIRNSMQWSKAPSAIPGDIGLAAYTALLQIVSRSLDILYAGTETPSGLQASCDYMLITKTIETQIVAWQHEWTLRQNSPASEAESEYRMLIGRFYYNYYMLVVNSFGLQNALERSAVDIGYFFATCHSCATACALIFRDELGPKGYLKYSPDSHFVFVSYAVLSLLKLVRPEFQAFLDHEQSTLSLVKDVADLLENIAASPMHTPHLYSVFLRALLSARTDNSSGDASSGGHNGTHLNGDTTPNHKSANDPFSALGGDHQHQHHGSLSDFQFGGEMGPAVDITTFPPTMAPSHASEDANGMLSIDSILSTGFWDNVLIPGYSSSFEGLSGGFVYGAGGSGLITPRLGMSPSPSGRNTPARSRHASTELTQQNINAAFNGTHGESNSGEANGDS